MNMNKLATFTANGPTVNKKDSMSRLTTYVNNMSEKEYLNNREMLAYFYKRFTPAIPAKAKTPLDVVKRMMGVNDVRYYLNYVYVAGDDVVATDGARLSIAPNVDNLEDGFYDKNMTKIDENANYPDYKRVIPEVNALKYLNVSELDIVMINGFESYAITIRDDIKLYLNVKFVKDIIDKDTTFTLKYIDPPNNTEYLTSSVLISNRFEEMLNILMPVNPSKA